jgi:hypothetical protein
MELFISSRWRLMVVWENSQLTKLELNMEQVIVMLNAHMILNLSVERLIVKIGKMTGDIMVAAALSLMSGRLINMQTLILLILALSQVIIVVKVNNVAMDLIGRMAIVIKTDVTLIHSEMEIKISMVLDLASQLILHVHLR